MCKKSLLMMLLLALLMPWAANAQTSLFSEDFEGGSMPAGWTTDGSGSWSVGVGEYSASTGAGHGSYNAKITHGTTGNVTKLITPEIDLSTVASAELSFMHVQRSWAGDIDQLRVYYRTSSSGSWTQIAEYTAAFASWTTEDGIILPDLSSTYQIAFEHTDMYGYGVGVDNIVIVQGASCPKPTGLAATANGQSATLTWIGDASSFHVAYSTDGTANPDELTYTTVNTNSYTKDNLALDADHYFWVRAYCSATEQSNWAGPASVHIGYCVPAPTSVDNNGISNVTFGTGDYVVNNDTPKATYADYHTLIGAVQAGVEATIAITFKTSYTYNTYVWVDLDNSLSFDADEVVCYGESASTNPTTLTLNFTIPADQTLGDFRLRIGSADSGLGTDPAAANPCYSSSYGCFQDYTLRVLEAPSCLTPTGLAVNYTGGLTATATWDGTADTYNIDVNGNVTNNVTAPYTINGLELGTTYAVMVQANCSGNETSDWSNPVSFNTDLCMPENMCELTFKLTDAWGDGWNGAYIEVIDVLTGATIAQMANEDLNGTQGSGENEVNIKTLAVCDGRKIQFVWHTGSYDSEASYVVTDINGEVIFEGSGAMSEPVNYTVSCTVSSCRKPTDLAASEIGSRSAVLSWTENGEATEWIVAYGTDGVDFREDRANANPFTLEGLEPETGYTVKVRPVCDVDDKWSDAITFTTDVACAAPANVTVSDIEPNSATVSWTGEADSFEMEYATAGTGGNLTYDFEDGTLQGWTNLVVNTDGGQWLHSNDNLGGYDYTNFAHGGTGFAMSYSYVDNGGGAFNTNAYLVSPNSYQIGGNASLNFWYDFANDSYPDHMEVCVATAANPTAADFTPIWSWDGAKRSNGLRSANGSRQRNNTRYGNWTEVTLDLNAYAGQNIWIAFHHVDYDMYEVWVDDVTVNTGGELTWIPVGTVTSPYTLGNLEAETTYLVRVRANCTNGYDSQWLTGTFTTLPLCMVPTNLAISNIDKRSADLAWTANGDEEAWQISLNDGTNEQIIDVTATTYSFTGLTPETRYTVKVRAYCDADLQSHWSTPVSFTTLVACPAPTGLAISDITNVSAVATWTYDGDVELEYKAYALDTWKYYDNGVFGGGIGTGGSDVYWAIMLPPTMLTNEPLSKVAVYEASGNNTEPLTIMVYSGGDTAPGTLLYEETVNTEAADDFHEITLAEPVTFDATQNLWIVCKEYGTYPAQGSVNTGDANGRWISLDGTEWEDVANYGLDYTWMIRAGFGDATIDWVAVNNPASPQTLAGLTPETNYQVRLRAVCGGEDGESVWVNTSFTTDEACPAPTALAATPYALSAELSWEGISESYTVSYRTAAYTQGISEEFASSSIPTGWSMYTGLLSNVMEDPAALASATYGWTFGTGNGIFNSHARVNIYSNLQRWLVTPAIEVPAGSEFSFDMALTVYSSSSSASPTPGNQADDKFVVLVSTDNMATWTILRQWDNAGSEYVYDNITNNANGEHVRFDFSAYAGQTVNIAFYGESTASGGDNNLHIDNVAMGTAMPAGEWMTVDTNEATANITGLTPGTKYDWKVQGDCGDFGMSEESAIMSFTTTNDACPVPTNLTVDAETLTATTADLSWAGSPDVESFTVRYRVPEHIVGGMSESFDVSSVPAGWTKYSGLVDNVIAGTATLTTTSTGWNTNINALGTYNMKVNIWGSSVNYWLVTPEVPLTSGNFTFDLALTAYNSSAAASGTCEDDRFVVLVYANETWTILREWNNTGSDYVYNTIATEGEAVSIDLSAYVGQTVKIAFYGESTVSSNGDNDMHIDNVVIGNPQTIPATDWMLVENITDMNVTLTGLTPETPYEAQVKSTCSEAEEPWSNTVSFTTLEQTTVTQTIALAAGSNWVSFNVDITLDDLKAALVEVSPNATIKISGKTSATTYNPQRQRWSGNLQWDESKMYIIKVVADCEVSLEGMPLDPAEQPVSIVNGANYIAFPFAENMSLTNAFAGFAVNGDKIMSKTGSSTYNRGRWQGSGLTNLEPGKGYIYKSNVQGDRTLVFPSNAKK